MSDKPSRKILPIALAGFASLVMGSAAYAQETEKPAQPEQTPAQAQQEQVREHNPIPEDKSNSANPNWLQDVLISYLVDRNSAYFRANSSSEFKGEWEIFKAEHLFNPNEKTLVRMTYHPEHPETKGGSTVTIADYCTLAFGVDGVGQIIKGGPSQTQTIDGKLDNSENWPNYWVKGSYEFRPAKLSLAVGTNSKVEELCDQLRPKPQPQPEACAQGEVLTKDDKCVQVRPTVQMLPSPYKEYKPLGLASAGFAGLWNAGNGDFLPCADASLDFRVYSQGDVKLMLGVNGRFCNYQLSEESSRDTVQMSNGNLLDTTSRFDVNKYFAGLGLDLGALYGRLGLFVTPGFVLPWGDRTVTRKETEKTPQGTVLAEYQNEDVVPLHQLPGNDMLFKLDVKVPYEVHGTKGFYVIPQATLYANGNEAHLGLGTNVGVGF
ncbi:MAG: acid shock protein [Nanoarchaeota archaeon]